MDTNKLTLDIIQKYINDHNILNNDELKATNLEYYNYILDQHWDMIVKYPNKIISWEYFDTIEKVQLFIEMNNIISASNFETRFIGLYDKSSKFKWLGKLNYREGKKRWKVIYKSIDEVQQFIDNNDIKNPTEFINRFPGLYQLASQNKWLKQLKYSNRLHQSWDEYDTLESIQNLINSENIINPLTFKLKYISVYCKCRRLGWLDKLEYTDRTHNWSDYNTSEDILNFIKRNKISSQQELIMLYPGLYERCKTKNIAIPFKDRRKSYMEQKFLTIFPEEDYPSFIHNLACFDWLVYINKLRPDFYIPELNLVIEFQGSQHFIPHRYKDGKKKFELIKDRDRVKLNLLKSHNINVIYFVDIQKQRELEVFPELFEENGYMGETIWTDWNKLETYIKTELNKCTKYKEQ